VEFEVSERLEVEEPIERPKVKEVRKEDMIRAILRILREHK